MKNLKYFLIIIFVVSVSCENLLDEPVYSFRTNEMAFATEASTNAVLLNMYKTVGAYNYLGNHFHQVVGYNSSLLTRRTGGEEQFAQLMQIPNSIWSEKIYSAIFSSIAQNNLVLSVTDSTLQDTLTKDARGQAYFLRALNYFYLVRMWGPVPIITIPPANIEETYVPRAESPEDVYDVIIGDLHRAYKNLNEIQSSKIIPKKMAAYALLAKVYAQLGSMCEDKEAFGMRTSSDKTTFWELARDYADTVIQSEAYYLEDDYSTLFDLDNEFTEESIFEIGYSNVTSGVGCGFTHLYVPSKSGWSSNGTGGWGRVVCTREVYDTMVAVTGGSDARLETNLVIRYTRTDEKEVVSYPELDKGTADVYLPYPSIQKYKDPNGLDNSNHANNFIYLRYADVLLTYAEAVNEIDGPVSDAISTLNLLLARSRNSAGGSDIPADIELGQYVTKEAFRARIMTERLIELMGEAHDWFDARRRGRAYFKSICENHNARLDLAKTQGIFKAKSDFYFATDDFAVRKNLWFPIPMGEITNNEAIRLSDQNYGY